MKTKPQIIENRMVWLFALLLWTVSARSQTTLFTYQGQLTDNGAPVTSAYEFQFTLFDSPAAGSIVAGPIITSAAVSNGLFTVALDFGQSPFSGEARWLEIAARTNGGSLETLTPRQQITSTPYAITARTITGSINAPQVPSLDASKITTGAFAPAQIPTLDASKIGTGTLNPARVPALDASKIAMGTLADSRLSQNVALRAGGNAFEGTQTVMNGNVGIGANPPAEALHVSGNIQINSSDSVSATLGSGAVKILNPAATAGLHFDVNDILCLGSSVFSLNGNNEAETRINSVLFVKTTGNVGIGTSNPTNDLHVIGGATVTGNAYVGGFFNLGASTVVPVSGGTLNPTRSYMRLFPSSSVTLSTAIAIANGASVGNVLIIENASASTVTIPNNANTILGIDRTLSINDNITLLWNGSNWILTGVRDN